MGVAATLLANLSNGANDDAPMTFGGVTPLVLTGTVNGVFIAGNAAAEVGVGVIGGERVLVLAFRGSDDRTDWVNDLRDINTDYAKFAPLIAAVEAYAAAHFQTVLVTGHSLGAAMTQVFMANHPAGGAVSYEAVAFGSPGALIAPASDPRITTYNVIDDPIVFLGANRATFGQIAANSPAIALAIADKLAASTPLTIADVLESIPFLTADYVSRGDVVTLNPGGREPLTLQNAVTKADLLEHKIELYMALSASAPDPLNQTMVADASVASKAAVGTANLGVLRHSFSSVDINADALRVDKGLGVAGYVSELVAKAQESSAPSLIVANFIDGVTPTSARLDSLTSFAQSQYDAYLRNGVADARLGPFEALGVGFSGVTAFKAKYGSGTDAAYIDASYKAIFKIGPTADQSAHFQAQDNYFQTLYISAGISADIAELQARGAVVGQMLGLATLAQGSAYQTAAATFLTDASDGSAPYGAPLIGVATSAEWGV